MRLTLLVDEALARWEAAYEAAMVARGVAFVACCRHDATPAHRPDLAAWACEALGLWGYLLAEERRMAAR